MEAILNGKRDEFVIRFGEEVVSSAELMWYNSRAGDRGDTLWDLTDEQISVFISDARELDISPD